MGVEDEFTAFVRARSSALLRSACLLTAGDRQAGEDLVQAALAHAFVRWGRIRDPNASEAYVKRIMFRMAVRRSRRKASSEVPIPEPSELAGGAASGSSVFPQDAITERVSIWPILQELSVQQRAVVVLRYYEDLTDAQIAIVLGCAPGTVKSHANRALQGLRRSLGRNDGARHAGPERSGT
jgi:RNA polymerase sigma-70 factor (sigma-E family)